MPLLARLPTSAATAATAFAVAFFCAVGLWRLYLPGLYYDEALFVPPAALLFDDCSLPAGVAVRIGCVPIILQPPYLGSLKALLYGPLLSVLPVTPTTIRAPMVLLLLASLLLFAAFWRRRVGPWAGLALTILLLTDVAAIGHARVDWGPYVLSAVFKMLAVCLAVSWIESRDPWRAVQFTVAIALGVFDKLNFLWVAGAIGAAALLVYPREIRSAAAEIDKRTFAILAVTGVFGLAWLFFGIIPTIRAGDGSDRAFDLQRQAVQVWSLIGVTLDVGAYEFFYREPWPGLRLHALVFKVSLVGGLVLAAALAAVRRRHGRDTEAGRMAAYSAFVTLVVFFTIVAMVLTKQTGGTHHVAVLTQLWQLQLILLVVAICRLVGTAYPGTTAATATAGVSTVVTCALVAANVVAGSIYLAAYHREKSTAPVFSPLIYDLAKILGREPALPVVTVDWGIGNSLTSLLPAGQRHRVKDAWPMFVSIAKGVTAPSAAATTMGDKPEAIFVMRSERTAVFPDAGRGFERALAADGACRARRQEMRDHAGAVQFVVARVPRSCLRSAS